MSSFLLKNLTWHDGSTIKTEDIRTDNNFITETGVNLSSRKDDQPIDFGNSFIYPGFINSHDHLEMNLYPRLGTPPYHNYIEWSLDIYKPNDSPIREIESIPVQDRLLWGGLKNLISGVTTVVHHNPWNRFFEKNEFPITVLKNVSWAHSMGFEKEILKKFRKDVNLPFVIHAGEGIDALATAEIHQLNSLGVLKNNTVLIHAIAIDTESLAAIKKQKTSVVWCPASNLFMFNKTTPADKLISEINVALGTDSTLTGATTLLEEMFVATKTGLSSMDEVYKMVTSIASSIFNLNNPVIAKTKTADLFVVAKKHDDYFENLKYVGPEDISMVMVKGKLQLLSADVRVKENFLKHSCKIKGQTKKLVADFPSLKNRIEKKVGTKILEQNPLWTLLEV